MKYRPFDKETKIIVEWLWWCTGPVAVVCDQIAVINKKEKTQDRLSPTFLIPNEVKTFQLIRHESGKRFYVRALVYEKHLDHYRDGQFSLGKTLEINHIIGQKWKNNK